MASTFAVKAELKSNPQKVWECVNDFTNLFPKLYPQVFESIVALEGDGNSLGSVRKINYAPGVSFKTNTQKIVKVDEENKIMSYIVIDGDLLKLYKSFGATIAVSSKGDGSSVTYSGEYVKPNEQVPDPDKVTSFIIEAIRGLDAYLLKA